MKTYSHAPDATNCIHNIQADNHAELDGVTVSALFVFDTEATEAVLKHQGYPAQAVVRIVPIRDRALGMADANIVIDRSTWMTLSQRQRDALIDHELTHLTRSLDKETGHPLFDALDRPKLAMRRHDMQIGFFTEVLERHGDASYEARATRQMFEVVSQLHFDFGPKAHRPVSGGFQPTKTGAQIDAEIRANHPGGDESVVHAGEPEEATA